MYVVTPLDHGKYLNVEPGERWFYSFREAKKFSEDLNKVGCEHKLFKTAHLDWGCIVAKYPYKDAIKMFDFEVDGELNWFQKLYYRVFYGYDSKVMQQYLWEEEG